MLIRIILSFLLLNSAQAAVVSRITTFEDGQVLTAADLNSEFDNIIDAGVNSIVDSQISDSAQIDPIKLDLSIAGSGLARDGITGILSVGVDALTIELAGDELQVKAGGIGTTQLADDAVTSAKIDDGVVGTVDLADGAVTQAKRAALGQQISNSDSGSTSSTSLNNTDITDLTVTITTTGRPIFLGLVSNTGSTGSLGSVDSAISGDATGRFEITEGVSKIIGMSIFVDVAGAAVEYPCSTFFTVFVPSAGAHTYFVRYESGSALDAAYISNCRLVAYEL